MAIKKCAHLCQPTASTWKSGKEKKGMKRNTQKQRERKGGWELGESCKRRIGLIKCCCVLHTKCKQFSTIKWCTSVPKEKIIKQR